MSLRNWKDTNAKRALFVQWTAMTEPEKAGKQMEVCIVEEAITCPERFQIDQCILPDKKNPKLHIFGLEVKLLTSKRRLLVSNPFSR
jgi:hypothetical protein